MGGFSSFFGDGDGCPFASSASFCLMGVDDVAGFLGVPFCFTVVAIV